MWMQGILVRRGNIILGPNSHWVRSFFDQIPPGESQTGGSTEWYSVTINPHLGASLTEHCPCVLMSVHSHSKFLSNFKAAVMLCKKVNLLLCTCLPQCLCNVTMMLILFVNHCVLCTVWNCYRSGAHVLFKRCIWNLITC